MSKWYLSSLKVNRLLIDQQYSYSPETIYETGLSICIQFSGHLPRYGEIRRFLYHQRICKEKSYPFPISTGNKNELNFLHFPLSTINSMEIENMKYCSQTHYNFTDIFAKGKKTEIPTECNSCVTFFCWILIPSKLLSNKLSQLSLTRIATVVHFQYIETFSTIFHIKHAQYEHIKYRYHTTHLFLNYLLDSEWIDGKGSCS